MASITYDLGAVFQATPDLEEAKAALIREATVRQVMSETGEDRKTITDMIDAIRSMGQEAVLELTEGDPTTLADALHRYVDALEGNATNEDAQIIAGELSALLAYPWPGVPDAEALSDDTRTEVERWIKAADERAERDDDSGEMNRHYRDGMKRVYRAVWPGVPVPEASKAATDAD